MNVYLEGETHRPELQRAIGAVAMASANLDDSLRIILEKMVGSEVGMYFIQGQSTEWLLTAVKTQMREIDPQRIWHPSGLCDELLKHADRASEFNQYRSWIIHGCFLMLDWDEGMPQKKQQRPFGEIDDGSFISLCMRSKKNKSEQEIKRFSIGDIDRIAAGLEDAGEALINTWYQIRREKDRRKLEDDPWDFIVDRDSDDAD